MHESGDESSRLGKGVDLVLLLINTFLVEVMKICPDI